MAISHWHFGISIGSSIGITSILFLPYEICFEKNCTFMSNAYQCSLLFTVMFANLLLK